MPLYLYECKSCKKQTEERQSFSDAPLMDCPSCLKPKLFRVVTGGLGFFVSNRTVGAVADNNTSSFSDDFKNTLNLKNKTKKKDELSSKLKDGAKIVEQPASKSKAWYKKNQKVSTKKLQEASPKQLEKYIEHGTI